MQFTLYKLKNTLVWGFSLISLAGLALGTFLYTNKLARKESTAPLPSGAAQNACYLEFTVESPPSPPPPPPPPPPPSEGFSCVSLNGSPLVGESPLEVAFNAVASNEELVVLYKFDFGDGDIETSTDPVLNHVYNTPGVYTASVVMQNADGDWTLESEDCQVVITVSAPPPPEILECASLVIAPTTGDFPLTVNFTAAKEGSSPVSAYRFTFGDGESVTTSGNTTAHTYQEAGTYTATVQLRDAQGVWTDITSVCSGTVFVTIPPPPPEAFDCASLTANYTSGNAPFTVELTAAATIPERAASYTFTFGDGTLSTTTTPTVTHTYTAADTFTAYVTILDSQNDWTSQSERCTVAITAETPPVIENPQCNDVCSLDNDLCGSGTTCIGMGNENLCRKPSCSAEPDCVCKAVPAEEETLTVPEEPLAPESEPAAPVPHTGGIMETLGIIGAAALLIIVGLIL